MTAINARARLAADGHGYRDERELQLGQALPDAVRGRAPLRLVEARQRLGERFLGMNTSLGMNTLYTTLPL